MRHVTVKLPNTTRHMCSCYTIHIHNDVKANRVWYIRYPRYTIKILVMNISWYTMHTVIKQIKYVIVVINSHVLTKIG